MFDLKHRDVPCVGVSIGMERLFSIMEANAAKSAIKTRTAETEVFVASAQKNLIEERMKICAQLWDNDIKVLFVVFKYVLCKVNFICTMWKEFYRNGSGYDPFSIYEFFSYELLGS